MTTPKPPKLPPTAHPSCGTSSGYTLHRRRGESVCEPCQLAGRTRAREAARRRLATPEGREAHREASRRRRATPEGRAANRAASLAAMHRRRDELRARTHEQADADFLRLRGATKPCKSCGEVLPAEAFNRNWTAADGREPRCERNGCARRHRRLKQLARVADHRGLPKGLCAYCETGPVEHIDHFYPVSKGGPDHLENYVPSCASCNWAKSDQDPWEYLAQHHRDRLPFFRNLFKETP